MTRLGVGFIGSGFNAKFHMLGWKGVRDADVRGVWSPNKKNAAAAAAYATELDVGDAKPYKTITEMVVRHLLTKPGEPLSTVKPVRVTGHIASLKWTRPAYAARLKKEMGNEVDYTKTPSEDFASVVIEFETDEGTIALGEATTSWSFVGAGLRLSAELLGPEYSLAWNSLDVGLKLFFSREVKGKAGEDLVEKQNAEMGLMPVVANEAVAYGYEAEDRHFTRVFLGKEEPRLTFDDGLEVVKMLMTAYQSAEQGKTLSFPPKGIEQFVPQVAKGEWKVGR